METPQTVKILGRFIVADPKVCHGQPTFRGTRIFVADVLDQVARGLDWETIICNGLQSKRAGPAISAFVSYKSNCDSLNEISMSCSTIVQK